MIIKIMTLLSGVGLFLYGIGSVSAGASEHGQKLFKSRLSAVLSNGFTAVAAGAGVTAFVQSSSAVNGIAVKLADCRMLEQKTAFYIIMGANIGTTATAYLGIISSLDISYYFSARLLASVFVWQTARNGKIKKTAELTCGISIVFIGLVLVNDAVSSLRGELLPFLTAGDSRLALFFSAAILTAMIQSSSLTSLLLVSLASSGLIDVYGAAYMVMAINIGACGSVLLTAIGCRRIGASCALFHLFFNIAGTAINVFMLETGLLDFLLLSPLAADIKVALYHTFFNAATTLFLFFFIPEISALFNRRAERFEEQLPN